VLLSLLALVMKPLCMPYYGSERALREHTTHEATLKVCKSKESYMIYA